MQVTVKCLSGKKKTLVQDDYTSILLDYHYLSKGLRLKNHTSAKVPVPKAKQEITWILF